MCIFSIEICKFASIIFAYFCTNPPSSPPPCSPSLNSPPPPSSSRCVGSNKRFTSHNLSALSSLSTFSSFLFFPSSSSSPSFSTAASSSFLCSSLLSFARFATSSALNRLADANTSDIVTTTGSFPNFAHGIFTLKLPTTPLVRSIGKFNRSNASGFSCNRRKITSPESTLIFKAVLSMPRIYSPAERCSKSATCVSNIFDECFFEWCLSNNNSSSSIGSIRDFFFEQSVACFLCLINSEKKVQKTSVRGNPYIFSASSEVVAESNSSAQLQ